jgi:hypothetical protein
MIILEDVKKTAEEYMAKEIEMLYQITLLSKEDSERFKTWFITHPHYKRLQDAGILLSNQQTAS